MTINKDRPAHIVTNGKPLFVPYTQVQYMHFKIIRDQKFLAEAESAFERDRKNMEDIRKQIADYPRKPLMTQVEKIMYSTDTSSVKNIRMIVNAGRVSVNTWKNRLTRHQHQFSVIDKKSPAFINNAVKEDFSHDRYRMSGSGG